ncbi:lipopolysaccharide kinase InaA family protein [Verrucomicrobiota bacterium]
MKQINHMFQEVTSGGLKWWVNEDFREDFPVDIPSDINLHQPDSGYLLLQRKSGRSSLIVRNGRGEQGDIVIKQYEPRTWLEYIKYFFKKTRAESEWKMNYMFRARNIPTPMPLAWGEKKILGFWKKSVLILQAVSPCVTLFDYLKESHDDERISGLIEELAMYVARLHNADMHYRDLHGENILLQVNEGELPRINFIDLHEVRRVKTMRRWMCVDDLGRLNGYIHTSASHRIRFLKRYLKERNIDEADWKKWAWDIDKHTKAIWHRHYRKRGVKLDKYHGFATGEAPERRAEKTVLMLDKVLLSQFKKEPRGVEVFNLNLIRDLAESDCRLSVGIHESWKNVIKKWVGDSKVEIISCPPLAECFLGSISIMFALAGRKFSVLLLGNVANRLIPVIKFFEFKGMFSRCVLIAHREVSRRFLGVLKPGKTTVLAVNKKIALRFQDAGFSFVKVHYGIADAGRFWPREDVEKRDTVDFCVLGHLDSAWKGADTAIEAFRALPENVRNRCRLHLASYHNPVDFQETNVMAHSWMSLGKMPDFIRDMDVLLVPSRDEKVMRETFSQAMVQGMLTGLPVIVSDLPVLKEKLDNGGGIVFRTVEECAHAMKKLADDPELRVKMGKQGRKTALKRYVWDTKLFIHEFLFSKGELDIKERTTANTHNVVADMLFNEKKVTKVLDLPCGAGAFTKRLIDKGYDTYSGDIVRSIKVPEANFNLCDMSRHLTFYDDEFDAVVCIDGIEHIERPFDFVRECGRILKDEGVLIVSTPNISALRSRWRWLLTGFHHKSKRPLDEGRSSPDHHIGMFSFSVLRYMLHTNGFQLSSIRANRVKLVSWIYLLLVPIAYLATWFVFYKEEKDPAQRLRNKEILHQMFSKEVLFGETLIVKAVKRKKD